MIKWHSIYIAISVLLFSSSALAGKRMDGATANVSLLFSKGTTSDKYAEDDPNDAGKEEATSGLTVLFHVGLGAVIKS